jgi:hypothetical protein
VPDTNGLQEGKNPYSGSRDGIPETSVKEAAAERERAPKGESDLRAGEIPEGESLKVFFALTGEANRLAIIRWEGSNSVSGCAGGGEPGGPPAGGKALKGKKSHERRYWRLISSTDVTGDRPWRGAKFQERMVRVFFDSYLGGCVGPGWLKRPDGDEGNQWAFRRTFLKTLEG